MHGENEKELKIGDATFRIRKLNPEVAFFWAMRLFGNFLSGAIGGGRLSLAMLGDLVAKFVLMSRQDSKMLQQDSLSCVYLIQESGIHPVLNSEGFCNYPDIVTAPVRMGLVIASFEFSIRDFFDPSLLAALAGTIPGMASMMMEGADSPSSSSSQSDSDTGSTTTSGTGNTL